MITLDVADLIVIAGRTLGVGSDAALGQANIPAAQTALSEARLTGGAIVDHDTAAAAAISLMHALLRHRPFALHGEQIAVAAALQFLSLNGWRATLDPPAAAAVVVEALARGQLSPANAAAWLSPRLASPASTLRKPLSVSYPRALLFVQAACWALGSTGGLTLYVSALVHGRAGVTAAALALGWLTITGGLAVAKLMLGRQLGRDRSRRTWRAAIATEIAMTCFGVLWLAMPSHAFILPGLSGAALSLAAVLCMNRPSARQHFTGPDPVPGAPGPDALSDRPGFWQVSVAPGIP